MTQARLPLDQQAPQMFFTVTGSAREHQGTDLVLMDKETNGRIRVRQSGQGRVVMLGHNSRFGLQPAVVPQLTEPFTMDVMYDRPDWGDIHLRLIQRAVLWAKGETAGQRVAIDLVPLPAAISTGTPQTLTVSVLNETDAALAADLMLTVASRPGTKVASLEAKPGLMRRTAALVSNVCSLATRWPLPVRRHDWRKRYRIAFTRKVPTFNSYCWPTERGCEQRSGMPEHKANQPIGRSTPT